jgi:hypothetical protein
MDKITYKFNALCRPQYETPMHAIDRNPAGLGLGLGVLICLQAGEKGPGGALVGAAIAKGAGRNRAGCTSRAMAVAWI